MIGRVVRAAAGIATAVLVVAAPGWADDGDGPRARALTADTIVERMRALPVDVALTDVRPVEAVPPSAVASMVAPRRYLVPVGVARGAPSRPGARPDALVRRDAARVSVRYVDRGVAIQAGWTGPDDAPRPWLAYSSPRTGGVPIAVRPVLDDDGGGDAGLVLREVIAIDDAGRLYLRADRDGVAVVVAATLEAGTLREAITPRRAGGPPP